MKRVAFLRHTKSSWDDESITDFERPLSSRGLTAAPLMGNEIKRLEIDPEIILCSPSRRTRDTLRLTSLENSLVNKKILFDEELYLATPDILLSKIRSLPNETSRALFIGHNPGLQNLILLLVQFDNSNNFKKIKEHFPTGSLALIEFSENNWQNIRQGTGSLLYFSSPRLLQK